MVMLIFLFFSDQSLGEGEEVSEGGKTATS